MFLIFILHSFKKLKHKIILFVVCSWLLIPISMNLLIRKDVAARKEKTLVNIKENQ